jgi:HAD superfamily hydrolase (TIGR01549 family)
MSVGAVSFDLGHTLLFPRYEVYARLAATAGLELGETEFQGMESRLRPWFDEVVTTGQGLEMAVWIDYYRRFFTGLGVPQESVDPILTELGRAHEEGVGLWTVPAEDAEETLGGLKELGLRVVCVSNNDGRLTSMIEQQDWSRYFDVLVDSEVIGITKPDPRIFEPVFEALDLEPSELLHVGDYYSVDVVGARRAGSTGILYDPLESYGEVDCPVIARLGEVFNHLDQQL